MGLALMDQGQYRTAHDTLEASVKLLGPDDVRRPQAMGWIKRCKALRDFKE